MPETQKPTAAQGQRKDGSLYQKYHPPGTYTVSITGHAFQTPEGNDKNPFLRVRVRVDKIINLERQSNVILGSEPFVDLYFTEKTIEKTKRFLHQAGFRGTKLDALDEKLAKIAGISHISLAGYSFTAQNKPEKRKNREGVERIYDKFQLPFDGNDEWKKDLRTPDSRKLAVMNTLWGSARTLTTAAQATSPPATQQHQPAAPQAQNSGNDPAPFGPDPDEFGESAETSDSDWD